jgi:hypothetical protein
MQLSKVTLEVLKQFSSINTNLVVKAGKKISTMSVAKDIMAEFEGEDDFTKEVSIYNLNELLGVLAAFKDPTVDLEDKYLTISEGKQKVKYVYADSSLLVAPTKSIVMPQPEVEFELLGSSLDQLKKMGSVLGVGDIVFVGDGKKVIARVCDVKNPTGNALDIDLDAQTTETFSVHMKLEKLKLFSGVTHKVELSSKKISRFTHETLDLKTFIAIEADSTFA